MHGLARVYLFAILVTAGAWCVPLFVATNVIAEALASPSEATRLLLRLLGSAWAALCIAYVFAVGAAFRGERRPGTLWAAVAANGGTCFFLAGTIVTGAWEPWPANVRWLLLAAAVLSAGITGALAWYGLLFDRVFGLGRGRAAGTDEAPGKDTAAPPAPADTGAAARTEAVAASGATAGAAKPGLLGRLRRRGKAPADSSAGDGP